MHEINFETFSAELDAAMQAHLEWSRRVLRCAVLRTSPGDDALKHDAHTLCRFGRWLTENIDSMKQLDADRAILLVEEHKSMHDSVRSLCNRILEGKLGKATDLVTFETTQTQLIDLLANFKTLAVTRCSQIDALTELPLRHSMEHDFNLLTEYSRRYQKSLGIMMVDIDHFKCINDEHGHEAGDIVLQQLAASLKKTLRDSDVAYRFGGEEFLLLIQVESKSDAETAAKRVLKAIRDLAITLPDNTLIQPTATIGVTLTNKDDDLASTIKRADTALYEGKESGRDRYILRLP